jgi:hypothetical protein
MSSKTPFEIRTELLSQAQSILFEGIKVERLRLESDWNTKREIYFTALQSPDMMPIDSAPDFPDLPTITTEEVIDAAKKLNDFVSNG